MNIAMIVGNVGKIRPIRYTPTGRAVLTFSVATNRRWNDDNGAPQEQTDWHNIETWGRTAEVMDQHLTVGRKVAVEGRIQNDRFEQNGETKYFSKIVARNVEFLGKKPE